MTVRTLERFSIVAMGSRENGLDKQRRPEQTGNVAKTCRYFGLGGEAAYKARGEQGLINAKPISRTLPDNHR